MAIKSRLRLNQINDEVEDFAVASVSFSDASSASADFHQVMQNIAVMIEKRFGLEQSAGTQANVFNTAHDLGRVAHFGSGVAADLIIRHEAANNGIDIDSAENIEIDAAASLSMNAGAASDLTVDAGGLAILSTGDAASFTVASDSDSEDLTIAQTGAVDAGVLVQAAGTGTDAIKLHTTAGGMYFHQAKSDKDLHIQSDGTASTALNVDSAGGFDLDAAGLVSLETSAGSFQVGTLMAASNSIAIGAAAQNEILMTRGASASDNTFKISSQGTAAYDAQNSTDASMQMESAGGIALVAADTSLVSMIFSSSGGLQAYAQGTAAQNWNLESSEISNNGQDAQMYLESAADLWMGSSSNTGGTGNFVLQSAGGARTSAEIAAASTAAEAALAGSGKTYGSDSLQDVIDMMYADVGAAGTDTIDCLWLNDANRSGWSVNSGIPLSLVQEDWSEFEAAYGEVSLLRGIIKAGVGASDKFYHEIEVGAGGVTSASDIYGATVTILDETGGAVAGAPAIDSTTSLAELQDRIEVYVNGQRMALNGDCTPTIASNALKLVFDFDLELGDLVIVKA